MGSIANSRRNERFIDAFENKIVSMAPIKKGDLLDVTDVYIEESEDGTEVAKLFLHVRNVRTGKIEVLTRDRCLYDPEGDIEDNTERIVGHLSKDTKEEEKENLYNEVIESLEKMEL